MMVFSLVSIVCIHITTCLFLILPSILQSQNSEDEFEETWMEQFHHKNVTNVELYCISMELIVQTITTVGYGDIPSLGQTEVWIKSFMMLLGVIGFTFANGSFASIVSNYDSHKANR